jgi:hypothetical protein
MIKAITICDAAILVPNKEHKNFTDTGKIIPKDTTIFGNPTIIQGLRRGQPFEYKLFVTDKNEFIYLKTIQTMKSTEVLLGADASNTATVVKIPNDSNLGMYPVLGTILGGVLGYYYAKKKNPSKVMMFTVIGGVAGFAGGKYLQGTGIVLFKKSK